MAENGKSGEKAKKELLEIFNLQQNVEKGEGRILQMQRERNQLSKELGDIAKEHLNLINQEEDTFRDISKIQAEIAKLKKISVDGSKKDRELADKILQGKEKELQFTKENQKFMGITGKLLEGASNLTKGMLGLNKEQSKELNSSMMSMLKSNEGATNMTKALKGSQIIAGALGRAFLSYVTSFETLSAIAFEYSSQIASIRNELGLSYGEAHKLREEFTFIAAASGDLVVNSARLQKTFGELNRAFGTGSTSLATKFPEVVTEATKLREAMGLSAQSTAELAKMAIVSGKSLEQQKLAMIGSVKAVEAEFGARLNMREVMEETGKVTGQVRAQLQANPELIARAVAVAKELGMTLEGVAKAAGSLLNFEQNIENELEAELLLGKQINLERARAAALAGDFETVAKEINEQVGSFADFSKLNVLQQNALAKSVGMTSDELADQLLAKENLNQLAEEARAQGNEELARQLEARSAQQKIADIQEKLVGFVGDLIGPLTAVLDLFVLIMEPIGFIAKAVGYVIGGMVKLASLDFENMSALQMIVGAIALSTITIMNAEKIIRGLRIANVTVQRIFNRLKMRELFLSRSSNRLGFIGLLRSIGKGIMTAFTAGAKAPFPINIVLPLVMAGIATALGVGLLSKFGKGDDIMSDGYGKRTLLMPEGAIRLNDRDTVIAGTNLTRGNDVVSGPSAEMGGSGPTVDQMTSAIVEGFKQSPQQQISFSSFNAGDPMGQGVETDAIRKDSKFV